MSEVRFRSAHVQCLDYQRDAYTLDDVASRWGFQGVARGGEPIGRFSANDAELRGEQVIAGTDSKQAEVGEQQSRATDRRENDLKEGEDDEVRIGQAGTLEAETFGYLAAGQPAGEQPSDVCREQLVVCCLRANTVLSRSRCWLPWLGEHGSPCFWCFSPISRRPAVTDWSFS
ncbi:hypothetical protein K0M31_018899 [Melipona bicolor]|uniref:Uncharacterized protein n=1 Tax=Melipona bicolor TaxID=60889 RepID=A0AA40G4J9_9HYME|nr:hypothetical protein K0M31_018899 [Melipona bicolor]